MTGYPSRPLPPIRHQQAPLITGAGVLTTALVLGMGVCLIFSVICFGGAL